MGKQSSLITVDEFEELLQRHEIERKNESLKTSEEKMESFMVRMDEKFNMFLQLMGINTTIQEIMTEEEANGGSVSSAPVNKLDSSGFQDMENNFSCSHPMVKEVEQRVFDRSPPSDSENLILEETPKFDIVRDAKSVGFDTEDLIGTNEGIFSGFTRKFETQNFDGVKLLTIDECVGMGDCYDKSIALKGIVEKIRFGLNLKKVDNICSIPTMLKDSGVSENIWKEFNHGFEGLGVHKVPQTFEGMEMVIISIEGDKTIHEVWVEEITKFKGGTTCEYYNFVKLSASNNVRFFGSLGSEATLNHFGSSFLLYGHVDFNRPFFLKHEWQK